LRRVKRSDGDRGADFGETLIGTDFIARIERDDAERFARGDAVFGEFVIALLKDFQR
jgi:hypothetical protein